MKRNVWQNWNEAPQSHRLGRGEGKLEKRRTEKKGRGEWKDENREAIVGGNK